ncbi:MAG: hypothetical protein QXF35_04445 [Candidatus Bilamarchaeaceae archaeon]
MCKLCKIAAQISEYKTITDKMAKEDVNRINFTKEMAKEMNFLFKACYSSIKWPIILNYPFFEARTAYAVPSNYFQNILLDNEKIGNAFSHGSMRSVFFVGERLMLLSKNVNFREGKEFFTSFILAHFEQNEYGLKISEERASISVNTKKTMKNLITNDIEEKKIQFNFVHEPVKGRIITKERIMTSAQFKNIYSKYLGGAQMRSASIDLEGYAITVPHFAPHPYLLQLKEKFGYSSNREFQEHALDYFKEHAITQQAT